MKFSIVRHWAIRLAALAIVFFAANAAWACPSCKEALAAGDPERANLVRGFYWSILFMIATPFTILTSFGTYAYVAVKRAGRKMQNRSALATAESDAATNEHQPKEPAAV